MDFKPYEKLHDEELLALTGIVFRTEDDEGRPIVDFDLVGRLVS